jgi:hypothetical protein
MSLRLKSKKENWKPDPYAPKLTLEQTRQAVDDLHIVDYPHVERSVQDPVISGQKFALVSFCISEKNPYNVVAFAKIRGVYETEEEAANRARYLVRKVDSVNKIHTVKVGTPFPISEAILGKIDKVEVDTDVLNNDYLECEKKLRYFSECQEAKNQNDIQDRVEALKNDVKEDVARDSVDLYILKRNKMATSAAMYDDYLERIEQLKTIMIKTHGELIELESPDILKSYREVYEKRLKTVGLDPNQTAPKVKSYFEVLPTFDFLNNKC